MSFFDTKEEVVTRYCEQCKRETKHSRYNPKALFTCRDPEHVHG